MPAKTNNEPMASVLAKAQMELPKAVKSAENPFFNSRYAGLDEVIEACRNVLNKHGIGITQTVEYTPEVTKTPEGGGDMQYFPQQVFLVTTLLYQDQSIRSVMPLEYKKADMQSLGSAISYARRYSLQSICCLATDEPDDDANKAVGDVEMNKKGGNKRSNYRKAKPEVPAATTADEFLKP
jgi:hypothetical protein